MMVQSHNEPASSSEIFIGSSEACRDGLSSQAERHYFKCEDLRSQRQFIQEQHPSRDAALRSGRAWLRGGHDPQRRCMAETNHSRKINKNQNKTVTSFLSSWQLAIKATSSGKQPRPRTENEDPASSARSNNRCSSSPEGF